MFCIIGEMSFKCLIFFDSIAKRYLETQPKVYVGEMSFKCLIFFDSIAKRYLETQSKVYVGPFLQK